MTESNVNNQKIETKRWWESTTIRGIIVSAVCKGYLLLSFSLKIAGINIPVLPAGIEGILDTAIALIGGFVGDAIALIGRLKANKQIV